jgi:DNA adenine methylase
MKTLNNNKIKSPLNYIGGKYKLLEQITPLFTKNIGTFVELFAGGCNVGINSNAEKVVFNDNLTYLIDMYKVFQNNTFEATLTHINNRINEFDLSLTNENGYKKFRDFYNENQQPLDLFILIAFSFNHQIRFNNSHKFNNPFGKNRSSFNHSMKSNLENFIFKLKNNNVEFSSLSFECFDFSTLNKNDFVYCDPPYLITTGSYNDGKRGFKGWTQKEELELLNVLDNLNKKEIKFALSNVIYHKGFENTILKEWLNNNNYHLNYLHKDYSNSNYQTKVRDKNSSVEILVTNYISKNPHQSNLF